MQYLEGSWELELLRPRAHQPPPYLAARIVSNRRVPTGSTADSEPERIIVAEVVRCDPYTDGNARLLRAQHLLAEVGHDE